MIKGIVVGDRETIAKIKGLTKEVRAELTKTIWRIVIRLQRYVKEGKLSGQVLHVRTGTLRRSINADVKDSGWAIHGIVGTNVHYGRIHEFGFTGAVEIKEHLRMVKQAWGKPLKNPHKVSVKAHSRTIKLPERSFLRSALKDMAPDVRKELESAIAKTSRTYW